MPRFANTRSDQCGRGVWAVAPGGKPTFEQWLERRERSCGVNWNERPSGTQHNFTRFCTAHKERRRADAKSGRVDAYRHFSASGVLHHSTPRGFASAKNGTAVVRWSRRDVPRARPWFRYCMGLNCIQHPVDGQHCLHLTATRRPRRLVTHRRKCTNCLLAMRCHSSVRTTRRSASTTQTHRSPLRFVASGIVGICPCAVFGPREQTLP